MQYPKTSPARTEAPASTRQATAVHPAGSFRADDALAVLSGAELMAWVEWIKLRVAWLGLAWLK